jgi:hypothetical protein
MTPRSQMRASGMEVLSCRAAASIGAAPAYPAGTKPTPK